MSPLPIERELNQIEAALAELPAVCRYHGTNLDPPDPWRIACCDTGIPARKRRTAERALNSIRRRLEESGG